MMNQLDIQEPCITFIKNVMLLLSWTYQLLTCKKVPFLKENNVEGARDDKNMEVFRT